jgi:hypothetical protein
MKYDLLGCCLSVLGGVQFLSQPARVTNVVKWAEEKVNCKSFLHSMKKS